MLVTGEAELDTEYAQQSRPAVSGGRVWSVSQFRLESGRGRPMGVGCSFVDSSGRSGPRQRLDLLGGAGLRTGGSLDVREIAHQLASAAVRDFADLATVDLREHFIRPCQPFRADSPLRRMVVRSSHEGRRWGTEASGREGSATEASSAGASSSRAASGAEDSPEVRAVTYGRTVRTSVDEPHARAAGSEPEAADGPHALAVPLIARGSMLGVLGLRSPSICA
ncbi:hypothetical protein [Streptomyces cadmiisoli]|uniref:GAF domain-containing protein n=1 Tax=Streptomyces cadmiisoli TaxID=2184053 RepID=A0A2Z4J9V5_9ACTN|nr:hypothetical protein [Streptomyces cadmiisoli]AWW41498.1 hypothetical protein DN051_36515 [Streptomyces cadmiisoli]